MKMIEQIKRKVSVRQIRTFSFILAIAFTLAGYLFHPEKFYGSSLSSFLSLLGTLFIFPAFTYKSKVEPLKIHTWLESKIDGNSTNIFLGIILLLLPVILMGLYFSFKSLNRAENLTQINYGFQSMLLFVIFLTFSFWERRQVLKKNS